ncbi:hypothetical protein [Cohnella lupini]|uniref:Uncharacterized protein n=1 Tax=Cohnella lupini TaxID=1294267 RepID=A0A3D9HQB0_9BACL|nr:hypothetical protein [Cohnella lupini]RED51639.1 hypothetical protein DFP95_14214 [Cohnella lupini]
MSLLKVLGWIFVPYIMIFVKWKQIGKVAKGFGTAWALFALLIVISNAFGNSEEPNKEIAPSSPSASTVTDKSKENSEQPSATSGASATSSESPASMDLSDMSALEPDKKLMAITDVFDVIGKTEKEVIEWAGQPEDIQESKFRLMGSDTKVPAKTLIYSEFGDYEYFLLDGKVQRYTYTVNPENGWRFEEKSLHDFMYTMGLKDAKLIEKNDKVAVYRHKKLFDIRVFSDGENISYLYIIADEKYN